MTVDAWITAAAVVGVLIALARELAPPPFVILGAVVGLLLLDVITTEQALAGFANPAPLTVAALYVVARAVQRTGGVTAAVEMLLAGAHDGDRPPSARGVLLRMLPPVMATSALLNNTPIVAVLARIVPMMDAVPLDSAWLTSCPEQLRLLQEGPNPQPWPGPSR